MNFPFQHRERVKKSTSYEYHNFNVFCTLPLNILLLNINDDLLRLKKLFTRALIASPYLINFKMFVTYTVIM